MGVFTPSTVDDLTAVLVACNVHAPVTSFQGLTEGVENSTFQVFTEQDAYIVTLLERRVDPVRLHQAAMMMRRSSQCGVICPRMLPAKIDGAPFAQVGSRYWCVQTFLSGMHVRQPNLNLTAVAGRTLAKIHLACREIELMAPNPVGALHWPGLACALRAIDPGADDLSSDMLEDLAGLPLDWPRDLPSGPIHGDYFISNVLADLDQVKVFDFFLCGHDLLAYDLALALTDWGFAADHQFQPAHFRAFLSGYQDVKPLMIGELTALIYLCRLAAIRIVLSRALDRHRAQRSGAVESKSPQDFRRRYEQLRMLDISFPLTMA